MILFQYRPLRSAMEAVRGFVMLGKIILRQDINKAHVVQQQLPHHIHWKDYQIIRICIHAQAGLNLHTDLQRPHLYKRLLTLSLCPATFEFRISLTFSLNVAPLIRTFDDLTSPLYRMIC